MASIILRAVELKRSQVSKCGAAEETAKSPSVSDLAIEVFRDVTAYQAHLHAVPGNLVEVLVSMFASCVWTSVN